MTQTTSVIAPADALVRRPWHPLSLLLVLALWLSTVGNLPLWREMWALTDAHSLRSTGPVLDDHRNAQHLGQSPPNDARTRVCDATGPQRDDELNGPIGKAGAGLGEHSQWRKKSGCRSQTDDCFVEKAPAGSKL